MYRFPAAAVIFMLSTCLSAWAQENSPIRDTLRSSRIVSDKSIKRDAGNHIVSIPQLRTMVSPSGEADAIKYIQTLPGVSTGIEGSSAYYVRGGNLGNNRTALDGVPIYGSSHLLGMTSAYSSDIVSSVVFRLGGFQGEENNLTSSHLGITSSDGDFSKTRVNLSASNFFLGGTVSSPIVKDKLSFIASARYSPIGGVFNLAKSILPGAFNNLDGVKTLVYDAFGKATWRVNASNNISLSIFNSMDAYRYVYAADSDESMFWENMILNLRHEAFLPREWNIDEGISYNHFRSKQGIEKDMSGVVNNLAIVSSIEEFTAKVAISKNFGKIGSLRAGSSSRLAVFNPGTASSFKGSSPFVPISSPMTDNRSESFTQIIHAQFNVTKEDLFEFMLSGKMNFNVGNSDEDRVWRRYKNPEFSFMGRFHLTKWLTVEATGDWTVQYYHSLEGIPLGWSLDMMIPSDSKRGPEKAQQLYAGILTSIKDHHISIGAYRKKMEGLVYFQDASQLFSPSIAGWTDNIDVGKGTSKGVEFLYEKTGETFTYKIAYTLSETDRLFPRINKGKPFPAKFDRRHILNADFRYILKDNDRRSYSLTGLLTYQSGHWETVPSGEFPAIMFFEKEPVFMDYYSSTNNFRMPPYARIDLGLNLKFKSRLPQELNVGIYNVLNKHNPFTITYDDENKEWKKISLLPIMPSISYHISFN